MKLSGKRGGKKYRRESGRVHYTNAVDFIRLYEVSVKRKSIIQPGFIARLARKNATIRKITLTPTRTRNDKR